MHELLQQLAIAGIAMSPDLDEQAVGAYRVACIRQQHLQQAQLQLRESNRVAAADSDGVLLDIECYASHRERRGVLHSRSAQQGLDARQQGARTERLGEVIVGPQL